MFKRSGSCAIIGLILLLFGLPKLFFIFLILSIVLVIRDVRDWFD